MSGGRELLATVRGSTSGARAELGPMAALTLSEGAARLLSFGFYLLAARELTTAGFGVVRYTITLSVLAFGVGQVVVNALTREVGATRGDRARTGAVLGSGVLLGALVLAASIALCLGAAAAGLTAGADIVGLVVALAGLAALQLYYGIGRGLGQMTRPATAYAGGSLVQIVAFGLVAALSQTTPRTALLIFGLSSFLPVVIWELRRPVLWRSSLTAEAASMRRIIRLAAPLLVAEIAFLSWLSADQIWVQHVFGSREVGIYGAAKNLTQLLFVIPAGTSAVLMPRVAELRAAGAVRRTRRLVLATAALVLVASAALAALLIAGRSPVLGHLYGHAYRAGASSLLVLSLGAVANAAFVVLTTAAVGWGRPGVYAWGMSLAAVSQLVLLALLSGSRITTAAWAATGSIALALVCVAIYLLARPFDVQEIAPYSGPGAKLD